MSINAVILAAGYGTRLERDLKNDESGQYSHLIGTPKPLLPIGHLPLISHWIESFVIVPDIKKITVVINDLHKPRYEEWVSSLRSNLSCVVELISDGSTCNEERSGAVACMRLGAATDAGHTIYVAGDTLLRDDFTLGDVVKRFQELQQKKSLNSLVLCAPVAESNVSKHGIIEVNDSGLVAHFLEKPQPSETSSRLQCPCFYILSHTSHQYLENFIQDTKGLPISARDATGMFISHLITCAPVYAYSVTGRYDVGGLQSYIECHQEFLKKSN
ncbi:unnamed protein product, partial [Meganyctiphanes norvegica]